MFLVVSQYFTTQIVAVDTWCKINVTRLLSGLDPTHNLLREFYFEHCPNVVGNLYTFEPFRNALHVRDNPKPRGLFPYSG